VSALGRQLRLFGDLLTDPRRGFETLAQAPPLGSVIVVLGLMQAALWLAQSLLLEPVLRADTWPGEGMHAAAPIHGVFWTARLLVVLLAPLAMGLRAAGLATLLQASAALAGRVLPWRPLVSLALHLDIVLWVENAAVTLLLALARPANVDALHALRLRAGVDLLWQPASPAGRALLAAANLFSVWWGVLLGLGLAVALRLPPRPARALAGTAWAGLVVVRFLLDRS
jgi:hypothetical protein